MKDRAPWHFRVIYFRPHPGLTEWRVPVGAVFSVNYSPQGFVDPPWLPPPEAFPSRASHSLMCSGVDNMRERGAFDPQDLGPHFTAGPNTEGFHLVRDPRAWILAHVLPHGPIESLPDKADHEEVDVTPKPLEAKLSRPEATALWLALRGGSRETREAKVAIAKLETVVNAPMDRP